MNYFLTEYQQDLVDLCKEFAEKEIKPYSLEYDEKNESYGPHKWLDYVPLADYRSNNPQ